MQSTQGETWGQLPAITLPLPTPSRATLANLQALERDATGIFRALDGARWSYWGAARDGARVTLHRRQLVTLAIVVALIALFVFMSPLDLAIGAVSIITGVYLIAGVYKIWLLLRGERAIAGTSTPATTSGPLTDDELPLYTLLVPLHHEGKILQVLLEHLTALDYPEDKLEVLLLVESDDNETYRSLDACILPPHIRPVTVPPGQPRTKPRALNVGLSRASGELIVVYDAEDRPEPDQLRKAATAFRVLPRRIVCLQARLNFYNMRQSVLARLFAADYIQWYYMLLPGMVRGTRPFVPLGGTSNHFRAKALRRLGGWDPYNVTEDCDLGVRITRAGLQVDALDSTTWEEAVPHVRPWVRQRSRWVKGYIQTYLVHMRHPVRLWRDVGGRGFFDFQSLVGGSSMLLLVNPLMWALLLVYALAHGTTLAGAIESLFPTPLYYAALLSFVAGNFLFFYTGLYVCVRHGFDDLTKYALLAPLYWVLMSFGAWAGVVSLARDPHYWAKTEHGVSLSFPNLDWRGSPVGGEYFTSASAVAIPLAPSRTVASALSQVLVAGERADSLTDTPSLSVVLPAYNEEALIEPTVRTVVATLSEWDTEFEVVVVNDGSHDRTGEILDTLAATDGRIRLITHAINRGYGAALVTGFESARNELIFYMDSDGQFDISELAGFLPLIEQYDVVWGYRRDRKDTWIRQLNAWGWRHLVHLFLGVSVRDVDCAFKLFRAEFFHTHQLETRGAMINAEMLYKLRRDGYSIAEVGVGHLERQAGRATGAKPAVIARAIKELLAYAWRWRIARLQHMASLQRG
jgi:cellulose synthase/poly-beta-1,6-N-acetylglucosamine synthase-like glycosyltransferase